MRVLLLEDDAETAQYTVRGFKEDGAVVDWAQGGGDALMMATGSVYDVLIFDRMVPAPDGLTVLKMLRAGGVTTPALFLTAVGGLDDRIEGLELADDYLVKPFAFSELRARVAAILRRPRAMTASDTRLAGGDLEIDLVKRTAHRAGRELSLQPTEFRLLEFLLRHQGGVVTRTMLLEHVWDFHFEPKTSIVETHISRLRAKVDRGFDRELIHTVRGAGYLFDAAR